MSAVKIAEVAVLAVFYICLVGAAMLLKAPELAMLAALTIIPFGLLVALRRDLTLLRKAASAGPLVYAIPALLSVFWAYQYPEKIAYFFVVALCSLAYFVCFGALIKLYWIRRIH